MADSNLNGKVAVITGGSRGLGRNIAVSLGKLGASVVVNYQANDAAAKEVADEVEANGGRAMALRCDVSDEPAVSAMFDEIRREFQKVDILVNNAGINPVSTTLAETEVEAWDSVLAVNLRGPFLCVKYAVPMMAGPEPAGKGYIINIGSVYGMNGVPLRAAYGTSKAGLICMTEVLAQELAPNINVNIVCPGPLQSPLLDQAYERTARRLGMELETYRRGMLNQIPLGRFGSYGDVVSMVGFLVSGQADYLTGAVIPLTGGGNYINTIPKLLG